MHGNKMPIYEVTFAREELGARTSHDIGGNIEQDKFRWLCKRAMDVITAAVHHSSAEKQTNTWVCLLC